MRHRLFFALNIDEKARDRLARFADEAEAALPSAVRRTLKPVPRENWHITISFLGSQDDGDLMEIMEAGRVAAAKFEPQRFMFETLSYGPPSGNVRRMIWARASEETSIRLALGRSELEKELTLRAVPFAPERRPFTGHLTLARFAEEVPLGELPAIERPIGISGTAASLDLMESTLGRGGAEYAVLQEFPFQI